MAKLTPKQKKRRVYDQNYYKAQAMLRDPWFIEKAAWLRKRFAEVGCPLPKKPFKNYKAYLAWNNKYWDRYVEMEKGPEFLTAKRRMVGDKEEMSLEEFYALEDFKDKFLPPVYGRIYDEMLEHYNIDRKDKGFRDFLELHFFFGQSEYPTDLFKIIWKRNEKTGEAELFLQIHGYTKKEDIVNRWNQIAQEQKYLKDFIGKSKAWQTFDRDMAVYELYKKLKKEEAKRRQSIVALDKDIWANLHKKYPGLTIGNIRRIISNTAKRLGEI